MKYLYFLLFGILILGLYQYMNSVSPLKTVMEEKIPSPDELWEKQQAEGQSPTGTAVELPSLKSETINSETIKLEVTQQQEVTKARPLEGSEDSVTTQPVVKLPTPNQLWEQQQQNSTENDLPAVPSDFPVISEEQRKAEDALTEQNTGVEIDQELFENDELRYTQKTDEYPPSEVLMGVDLFELGEFEKLDGIVSDDSGYTESLIDPITGISDKELMQKEDGEPASEVELRP